MGELHRRAPVCRASHWQPLPAGAPQFLRASGGIPAACRDLGCAYSAEAVAQLAGSITSVAPRHPAQVHNDMRRTNRLGQRHRRLSASSSGFCRRWAAYRQAMSAGA